MQLTPNFYREEFDCRDGSKVPAHLMPNVRELAANLQILRNEIGEPIHINSGYRTPSYNKKVGGKPASQHLLAKAADITVKSKTPKQLAAIVEKMIKDKRLWFGGIGIYPGFLHLDVRRSKARW
jgi:uncharacterized protein YcbK (DUF882 family)